MSPDKQKYKVIILASVIFVIALFFRTLNLNHSSETSDERRWLIRSSDIVNKIVSGDFKNATEQFERHPGIPAAFLMGIAINSLATPNNYQIPNLVKPFSRSLRIMNPLSAARIPIAIIGSLTCVFLFWFCYKIWGINAGTIAGMALALSPFHIALSRVAHQDAMLTFLFTGSILYYYLAAEKNNLKYRYIAGFFFGLALLTKIIAFLIPVIILAWKIIINLKRGEKKYLPLSLNDVLIFLIGILIFFALFPNMWQGTASSFLEHIRQNIAPSGLDDTYFYKGEVKKGPSWDFYYLNSLLRLSEVFIISIIIGLAVLIKDVIFRKKIKNIYILLIMYVFIFYFFITPFGKMKDRYFLVVWPILIIAASLFINEFIRYVTTRLSLKNIRLFLSLAIVPLFLTPALIAVHPNYFFYYNSLMPKNLLRWTVTLSRDEGLKQAAEFINNYPGGKKTLSSIDQFETYSEGKYIRFRERFFAKKQSKSANFIIWHIKNEQRRSPETMYREYVLKLKPIHIIKINGIEAVKIYLNPKKPLSDIGKD